MRPGNPSLRLGLRRYDLTRRCLVMGILNRTPDSFYDQGATWILRFGVQGNIVERTLARADLRRAQWRVHVPDELAVQLRATGVSPTPKPAGP